MPGRRAYLRAVAGTVAVGGAGPLAGCAGSSPSTGGSGSGDGVRTVEMVDLAFAPEEVAVEAGTTVRWRNASNVDHTVTAYADEIPADADYFASGGFDTESAARADIVGGLVEPGETYEHALSVPGRYGYCCLPHEGSGMVGVVRVKK
ncbi:MAG: plastocyanin/azurin family copper-binding protein [Haloferacaceae archaeon]